MHNDKPFTPEKLKVEKPPEVDGKQFVSNSTVNKVDMSKRDGFKEDPYSGGDKKNGR